MLHSLDVHAEPEFLEDLLSDPCRIVEGRATDNRSRRSVRDAQEQNPAAFVRDRNAVAEQFLVIELIPRFLELEILVLRVRLPSTDRSARWSPSYQRRNILLDRLNPHLARDELWQQGISQGGEGARFMNAGDKAVKRRLHSFRECSSDNCWW